jgi:predicted metal-dependent HD superfamily phosphohydrolase
MKSEFIEKSRAYAEEVLADLPPEVTYHTFDHTAKVAAATEMIGRECGLAQEELETVLIAAWFHDLGYVKGHYLHEIESGKMAEAQLRAWGLPTDRIQRVKQAIESTRMPQVPRSMIDKVLCDADMYHLSTEDAEDYAELLRKEIAVTKNFVFSDDEWRRSNYQFLKAHEFATPYGQTVLEEKKRKNVKALKKLLKKDEAAGHDDTVKELEGELDKLRQKLDRKSIPERGIETMFRIASENHITLSSMADTKANIMISINSIILSVVVSVLFRKIEEFPHLLVPTLLLVSSCLLTIIFAVLSTRPHVSTGKFTRQDIEQKKTNLLFFGNFHGMALEDYEWGVKQLMGDRDYLYTSLTKDIYFNGKVLARKYRLLRWSFNIFMFGFVAAIVGFIVALLMYYSGPVL